VSCPHLCPHVAGSVRFGVGLLAGTASRLRRQANCSQCFCAFHIPCGVARACRRSQLKPPAPHTKSNLRWGFGLPALAAGPPHRSGEPRANGPLARTHPHKTPAQDPFPIDWTRGRPLGWAGAVLWSGQVQKRASATRSATSGARQRSRPVASSWWSARPARTPQRSSRSLNSLKDRRSPNPLHSLDFDDRVANTVPQQLKQHPHGLAGHQLVNPTALQPIKLRSPPR
jgi:hypothetical protein